MTTTSYPGSTLANVPQAGTRRGNAVGMRAGTPGVISGCFSRHVARSAGRRGYAGSAMNRGLTLAQMRRVGTTTRVVSPATPARHYLPTPTGAGATRYGLAGLGEAEPYRAPLVEILSDNGTVAQIRLHTGSNSNATFNTHRHIKSVEVASKEPGTDCHFDSHSEVRNWAWYGTADKGSSITAGIHSAFGPCRATFKVTYAADESSAEGFPDFDRLRAELVSRLQQVSFGQVDPASIEGKYNPTAYPVLPAGTPEDVRASFDAFLAAWNDPNSGFAASSAIYQALQSGSSGVVVDAPSTVDTGTIADSSASTSTNGSTGKVYTTPGDVYGWGASYTEAPPPITATMPAQQAPQSGTGAPVPAAAVANPPKSGSRRKKTAVGIGAVAAVALVGGAFLMSRRKRRSRKSRRR